MTLIAGFRCRDGIGVFADTEMTDDLIRFQGKKLFHCYEVSRYDLAIAGSGNVDYIDMCREKIQDAVAVLPDPTFGRIKSEVDRIISGVHERYIFAHWEPYDNRRPKISLMIGIKDKDGVVGILQTDDNAISAVDSCSFKGYGQSLAFHIAEKIFRPGMSTAVMQHLAFQIFREVRAKGPYVGGNTEGICIQMANAEPFFDLTIKDYRFLWGLEAALMSGVRCALDREKDLDLLSERLRFIEERMTSLRADCEKERLGKGETLHITEFGSEYGNVFEDSF